MAMLQYGGGQLAEHPWELWFTLYSVGVFACLGVPVAVWWFLLPRARWWAVVAMAVAAATWIGLTLQFD
ncbi:MAG TPA: hypothetical protein VK453_13325 [Micromonosporaceae bacterium]|nr:hypothetical protein [Micromonosporaceae bacterium]